jgi:tyrosinase
MDDLFSGNVSRRVFVKGLGFIGMSLLMGTMGGCEKLLEAIKNRPVRRRLRTGSALVDADVATYRQAVSLMQGLLGSDQRSWANQAAIHGIPTHFNFCQHGTDHFFDWHRAYLFYFEKICQKLTGNAKFGLPYWNWNQNPDIHAAFLDTTSPLFLARSRTSMTGSSSVSTAELDPIFGDTNFFTFGAQIEGTPHNNVHGYIGGTLGGFASAQDPLFWMHHCMVDYCWAKWNIELGNDNTNDATWVNTDDTHFVDADGNPAHMSAGLTTILPLIAYQYESSAIGSHPATAALMTKAEYQKLEKRLKEGADVHFDVKQRIPIVERATMSIARPLSKELKATGSTFTAIVDREHATERVFVSVEYARLPPENDFVVRVFVDLPNANGRTPTEDPHYAGSFTFFGTESPDAAATEHHHAPRFLVNITETLRRLKRRQELGENAPVTVQLVPVPFGEKVERPDAQLVLDRLEVLVTPVLTRRPPD